MGRDSHHDRPLT